MRLTLGCSCRQSACGVLQMPSEQFCCRNLCWYCQVETPCGLCNLMGVASAGKTMLAKAVAHHTTAAFIRVVGSEFVQKYLGEVRTTTCCRLCCDGG